MRSPRSASSIRAKWLALFSPLFAGVVFCLLFSQCESESSAPEPRQESTALGETQVVASESPTNDHPAGDQVVDMAVPQEDHPQQSTVQLIATPSFTKVFHRQQKAKRKIARVSALLLAKNQLLNADYDQGDLLDESTISRWEYPIHEGWSAKLSPRGRQVAFVNHDGKTIDIYDCATRKRVFEFTLESYVEGAEFSHDGTYLLAKTDKYYLIYSLLNGRFLFEIKKTFNNSIKFAPDANHLISSHRDGTVSFLDINTNQVIQTLQLQSRASKFTFSANKDYLAYVVITQKREKVINIYDLKQRKVVEQISAERSVSAMHFSPDEELFTSADSRQLSIYQISKKRMIYKQATLRQKSKFLYLSNHEFISIDEKSNELVFFDIDRKKSTSKIRMGSSVKSMKLSPDGELIVLSQFGLVFYDLPRYIATSYYSKTGGRLVIYHRHTKKHLATVQLRNSEDDMEFSADNRFLICSTYQELYHIPIKEILLAKRPAIAPQHQLAKKRLWSFPERARIKDISPYKEMIAVTCKEGKTLYVHQLHSGKKLYTKVIDDRIDANDMKFVPNGEYIACSRARRATLYHLRSGSVMAQSKSRDHIYRMDFTRDSKYIVTNCYKNRVELYDLERDQPVKTYRHDDKIRAMRVSALGGYFATCSDDKTTNLYSIARDSQLVATLRHDAVPNAVAFCARDKYLAVSCDDGQVILYDIEQGAEKSRLKHPVKVGAVVFSPDGSTLAAACEDGAIILYHLSHERKQVIHSQGRLLNNIFFTPDGKYMVSSGFDGTVSIYDVTQGRMITTLRHTEEVLRTLISPDGSKLATLSQDNSIFVYDLAHQKDIGMIGHADELLGMKFSSNSKMIYQITTKGVYSTTLD